MENRNNVIPGGPAGTSSYQVLEPDHTGNVPESSEIILKHFFVFDSEHLDAIRPSFYGYTYLDDEIVTDYQGLKGRVPGKEGVYVYISREGNQIRLSQDFMGSYGLYLYRKDAYFAISNSLLLLSDYLKENHVGPLTLNKEFSDYMLCVDLASSVYGETLIQEITLLDRSAVIEINAEARTATVLESGYDENTIDPDSAEGIAVIDAWREKWARRFRRIAAETTNIVADLSGGFDTRLTLSLLLSSGIDLNKMKIYSITDELHTHKDDYRIAQIIARQYGFSLNRNEYLLNEKTPVAMDDILKISCYSKLGCHKELYFKRAIHQHTRYSITGSAGACVRGISYESEDEYIQARVSRCKMLAEENSADYAELCKSTENILRRSFQAIREKYHRLGMTLEESSLMKAAYIETRCRNHFGKANMEKYIENIITLSPLLDPDLYRLKNFSGNCTDPNLLPAIIFDRFEPGLAEIEIQGGRSIAAATMDYAKKINRQYPFIFSAEEKPLSMSAAGSRAKKGTKGALYSAKVVDKLILSAFQTDSFRRIFTLHYSEDVYNRVIQSTYLTRFHPLSNLYIAFGIVLVSSDRGGAILETIGNSLSRELAEKLTDALQAEEACRNVMMENELLRQELTAIRQSKTYRLSQAMSRPVQLLHRLRSPAK